MKSEMQTMELELTRTIPASLNEVFDGWLDPQCPGTPWNMSAKLVLDPRVDGLFYWLFINEAGQEKPHYGRFTIVDRPTKVQYTWMSLHTHGLESIVTVTFQQQGQETLMTLRHENLPDDDHGRGHEKGWGYFVGQFAERFTGSRDQS
jgi:uncharacterized protein YndB with AHSA1/START domain